LIGITPIIACLIIAYCMYRFPLGRAKASDATQVEELATL
jgi:hypothetical protein